MGLGSKVNAISKREYHCSSLINQPLVQCCSVLHICSDVVNVDFLQKCPENII